MGDRTGTKRDGKGPKARLTNRGNCGKPWLSPFWIDMTHQISQKEEILTNKNLKKEITPNQT